MIIKFVELIQIDILFFTNLLIMCISHRKL